MVGGKFIEQLIEYVLLSNPLSSHIFKFFIKLRLFNILETTGRQGIAVLGGLLFDEMSMQVATELEYNM